ncbi:Alpha-galactosidase [Colletotrichum sp. SAR 10_96]|nr:Alpha-galactosidase [Colletotrichum sp. SAR 10_96]
MIFLLCLLVTAAAPTLGAPGGMASQPQMGWNSWNTFKANINQSIIETTAKALVDTGLAAAGYKYLIMDEGWQADERATDGRQEFNSTRFPSGGSALVNHIHDMGLKVGIYSDSGIFTCGFAPGSWGYEDLDAQTYADWGIDYLKYDNCGGFYAGTHTQQERFQAMSNALRNTGRDIFYSLCQWGHQFPWYWADQVGAGSYRMSGDIHASFAQDKAGVCPTAYCLNTGYAGVSVLTMIRKMREISPFQEKGRMSWADMDMLEVGVGNVMSEVEEQTHFSFWAALKSPLIIGADVTKIREQSLKVLLNRDIIAISQDQRGEAVKYLPELSTEDLAPFKLLSETMAPDTGTTTGVKRGCADFDTTANGTASPAPPTLFPEYTKPGGTNRYDDTVGSIRSWDVCVTKRYKFLDPSKDFLVIIDNMMNLDMVFWVAAQLGDQDMYNAAVKHAETTRIHHIREDFSTFHVVNFEQKTGVPKEKITNQGYSDTSSWSRGQAWAIAGFAQTYSWTRDVSFLETAISCAEYFIAQLPSTWIPPWDFMAPKDEPQPPDVSAAMITAYGMLLIHEALTSLGRESAYLKHAIKLIRATCSAHMNGGGRYLKSKRTIDTVEHGTVEEEIGWDVDGEGEPETILNGATINNYKFAPRRWANHGLVYADYFFLLAGNKLLDMGGSDLFEERA